MVVGVFIKRMMFGWCTTVKEDGGQGQRFLQALSMRLIFIYGVGLHTLKMGTVMWGCCQGSKDSSKFQQQRLPTVLAPCHETVALICKVATNHSSLSHLQAAQNSASQQSSNSSKSSKSSSVGASVGTGGFNVTASASRGRGHADGKEVTWSNSHLNAGEHILLSSGSDTTLKGAVVQAPRINAQVGGNLHIQSLQDSSTTQSQQKNSGAAA
jgi:hypothetical protein